MFDYEKFLVFRSRAKTGASCGANVTEQVSSAGLGDVPIDEAVRHWALDEISLPAGERIVRLIRGADARMHDDGIVEA